MVNRQASIRSGTIKWPVFLLEGMNAFAATLYATYLYFLLARQFDFSNKQNLLVAAAHGLVATVCAWTGSQWAERIGSRRFLAFALASLVGILWVAYAHSASVVWQLACFLGWTAVISTTWPILESLASEHETPYALPGRVGVYNLVWSSCAAIAYFTGGGLIQILGMKVIYLLPVGLHLTQLLILGALTLGNSSQGETESSSAVRDSVPHGDLGFPHRPIAKARFFLKLGWLANPTAYIAIQCLIPIIPSIASRLGLDTLTAGVVCSVWMFSRMATFFLLFRWQGWHYRFRWFVVALAALLISFVGIRLSNSVLWLVGMQAVFGMAVGLIYYSSLYYSMDHGGGSAKHGGMHEAAIGLGVFVGPSLAATSLHVAPLHPHAGVWAVGLLMGAVFLYVIFLRVRSR